MYKLDKKYYNLIYEKIKNDTDYQVYRPLDSPMILISEVDGTPLASVHLKCQNAMIGETETGLALITKRPYESKFPCDFQGIVNRDNQEIEFVITNLTTLGYVKIDLMKYNNKVVDVDPGYAKGGLNKVNEIKALQSYAIQTDQKNDKSLILSAIEKKEKNEKNEKMTVEEAERIAVSNNEPIGTYYYISVVPQKDIPELTMKFSKTKWTCLDYICVTEKVMRKGYVPACNTRQNAQSPLIRSAENVRSSYGSHQSLDNDANTTFDPIDESLRSIPQSYSMQMEVTQNEESGYLHPQRAPICAENADENMEKNENKDIVHELNIGSKSSENLIKESFASTIKEGRFIPTPSHHSGIQYEYNVNSNVDGKLCVLCLSVSKDVLFIASAVDKNEMKNVAKMMIKDIEENNAKEMLKLLSRTFEEKNCVICLEEDAPPNVVFFQCGHKCCHVDCMQKIQKCPLCRQLISATILY